MNIREFQETIGAGLAEFTLGLAPATLDQVLAGAIGAAVIRPCAVLLLGFDDVHFPLRAGRRPAVGRRRARDAGVGRCRDRPAAPATVARRATMLAYVALTRASERILITYPKSESDGKPVNASAYLRDVLAALPGLAVQATPDPRASAAACGSRATAKSAPAWPVSSAGARARR